MPDEEDVAQRLRKFIQSNGPEWAYHVIACEAVTEIEDLRKQIVDLTDPTLKSMRLDDGGFNMELGGEVVKRVATMMTTWFRESGAKNFVEIAINAMDAPFEKYLFYVQKRGDGAMTPAEKTSKLEAQNTRLRDAVTGAIEAIEKKSTSAPVLECLKASLQPAE